MDLARGEMLARLGYTAPPSAARVPVVALTRRGDLQAKLAAFERGVDDILSVPFSPEELVARVLAVLRRTYREGAAAAAGAAPGRAGDRHPQPPGAGGGHELHLTALEQSLLYLLAANAGRLLTRDEILDHLWGVDYVAESNVVDRHVRNLRAKLQNDWRRPRYIATVPGRGYRFLPTDTDTDTRAAADGAGGPAAAHPVRAAARPPAPPARGGRAAKPAASAAGGAGRARGLAVGAIGAAGGGDQGAVDLGDGAAAAQRQGQRGVRQEVLDDLADAGLAPHGEPVDVGAAQEHRRRAQGQRLQHVRPAPDAAVQEDRHPPAGDRRHRRQGVQRRHGAVHLAPAVVGDHQAVRPVRQRRRGVQGVGDPLHQQRAAGCRRARRARRPR